ncbi:MAG TPA: cytochrome c biogenesis protein CcdA [Acidimicrobiales bacterium]
MSLVLIALVAGLIAGISPCILPVLPIIFAAGVATPDLSDPKPTTWRRSTAIVLGIVVSFSILVLAGTEILNVLHLPYWFLRWLGVTVLVIVGASYLLPQLALWLERPFVRLAGLQPRSSSGGFVVGLGLGLVFTPCAGPILASITVLGSTEHVSLELVFITVAFAVGAGAPLFVIAFAGDQMVHRVRYLRERAPSLRRVGGVVLIVMAVVIGTNSLSFLQRDLPGYTTALQNQFEGSKSTRTGLENLSPGKGVALAKCPVSSPNLVNCSPAPNFTDIAAWLNTPNDVPLTMNGLRGKVVLVDFWTYSCINCQRTLPHVEAWYKRYAPYGLDVVGVQSPEFAFEHVISNVKAQARALGVRYPIAVDNNLGTWNAYGNEYWPAEYLVDSKGTVRHVDFGEGSYGQTENLIRTLLVAANPGLKLPPPTSVPNLTPTAQTNPESYVGLERLQYLDANAEPSAGVATSFQFPSSLQPYTFALSGTWTFAQQEATTGANAKLELNYLAQHVYLVMGGVGTVQVSAGDGTPPTTIDVSGVPRLYTLLNSSQTSTGTMVLKLSPGVQAYDFTFG